MRGIGRRGIDEWRCFAGFVFIRASSRPEKIAALFSSAGVPCRISEYIEADIWAKFIMNCAGNAVAAIAQCSYAEAVRNPASRELMQRLMEETVTVGRCGRHASARREILHGRGDQVAGEFWECDVINRSRSGARQEHGDRIAEWLRSAPWRGAWSDDAVSFSVYAMVKLLEETEARRQQHAKPASSSQ